MRGFFVGLYFAVVFVGFCFLVYSYSYDLTAYRDGWISKGKYDRIRQKYKSAVLWLLIWPVWIVYFLGRKR